MHCHDLLPLGKQHTAATDNPGCSFQSAPPAAPFTAEVKAVAAGRAGQGAVHSKFPHLDKLLQLQNLEQTLSLEVQSTTCSVSKERAGQG